MAAAAQQTPATSTSTVPVGDIFLDEEERFEIFTVKAAERQHLLSYQEEHTETQARADTTGHSQEEKKDDDSDCEDEAAAEKMCNVDTDSGTVLPPPLVDGCDLPGWRRHRLAFNATDEVAGVLNVGPGNPLFRRADQLAFIPCTSSHFQVLMERLATVPPLPERDADIVDASEYAQLVCIEKDERVDVLVGAGRSRGGRTHNIKVTRFASEYERRNIPAKIVGAARTWKAMPSDTHDGGWTFDNLTKRFGDVAWRFSDTHGEMLTLGTYSRYISTLEGLTDDSPLGIYDALFGDEGSPTSVLLDEYTVPSCFSPDLFDLSLPSDDRDDDDSSSTDTRPPYRWILIGPPRSGTGLHVDPLWTNAWVTVLQGLKRWLLFPPCTPQEKIGMIPGQPQIPSSVWFQDYYDAVTSPDWPKEWRPVEVLQRPGETVFVPNGWPHLVLNLELTVAVTHNYASEFGPFERMWEEVATEESEFAHRWYSGMVMRRRKDLAGRVKECHRNALREGREWALHFGNL